LVERLGESPVVALTTGLVSAGRFGVEAGELLRVNCRSGEAIEIVAR
jgi:hypothetical protein